MSKRSRSAKQQNSQVKQERPSAQQDRSRQQMQQQSRDQQRRIQQQGGGKPDKFGTNPAPGESHVSLPPGLRHPLGGDDGYMDGFEDTMFA